MTTVTEIITDAFRKGNLIAVGATPTSDEQTEALRYLNRIVKSVFGHEAGEPLVAFPIGAENISRPSGYPWWNDVPDNDWFVPENTRVMLNLSNPVSLFLHPDPDNGSRFAAIDVAGNLATNNVTVSGNGRLIEGATSITLSTDDFNAEWFYREDTANWVRYATLALVDTFPFPEEFDEYFIVLLAMTLNPSYGIQMDGQTLETFKRSKTQFKARYAQDIPTRSELALIRMARTAADRDVWGDSYRLYNPSSMFEKGWPW